MDMKEIWVLSGNTGVLDVSVHQVTGSSGGLIEVMVGDTLCSFWLRDTHPLRRAYRTCREAITAGQVYLLKEREQIQSRLQDCRGDLRACLTSLEVLAKRKDTCCG